VCDSLGVEPDADNEEDTSENSFVHRMTALGSLVREKVRGTLHHGMKRAIAVVRSGFEYDMGLITDGFTSDSSKTEEENKVACLGLIKATEEPEGLLVRLFKDEVLPPADDEGL
jgi:1,4-alpha-glucan branching enzyme